MYSSFAICSSRAAMDWPWGFDVMQAAPLSPPRALWYWMRECFMTWFDVAHDAREVSLDAASKRGCDDCAFDDENGNPR
jgi:hypothetical protein